MTVTYSPAAPIFCAGCGHFGVQAALLRALAELDIPKHEVMVLAGIGCSGTIQNGMGTYGYHALHGRVVPTATGVHYANPDLTVVAAGGDGDAYAIGMGHLVHAFRRNPSFTYVVMNNGVYGLTKGQESPTAQAADQALSFDAVSLGLSIGSTTFVARGFAGWTEQLDRLMVAALEHSRAGKGFAFLEVLSPCVTYNDTYPVWESSLHDIDADSSYDVGNRAEAFRTVGEFAGEGRMVVGLIYRAETGADNAAIPHPSAQEISADANTAAYADILAGYAI